MRLFISSDWHLSPGSLKPKVVDFLEEAKDRADLIILAGDTLDRARHPFSEFKHDEATQKVFKMLRQMRQHVCLCLGNHDAIKSELEYLMGYKPGTVWSRLFVNMKTGGLGLTPGDNPLLVTHGFLEYDLGGKLLKPIYRFIFRWFPKLHFIYDRYMPTPSKLKAKARSKFYGIYALNVMSQVALAMRECCE